MNVWLDSQLAREELTADEHELVSYAKKNSDTNRCFDIDEVPINGPGKVTSQHPVLIGKTQKIAKKAKNLIDDD